MYKLIIVLAVALLALAACDDGTGDNSNPAPPNTNPPNNNGNQNNNDPDPPAAGTADLTLSNVNVLGVDAQRGSPYYRFEGTVFNNGNADASGFEVSCSYECPEGSSSFISIVQGGFVGANSNFRYEATSRIACVSVPTVLMNVRCSVDENNDVAESNENNNTFNPGQISLP